MAKTASVAERGSATPLLAVTMVVVAVLLGSTARLGSVTTERARIDAIADLSALAGATGGVESAGKIAELNGAKLEGWQKRPDGSVVVTVRDGGLSANAAAIAMQ